MVEGRAITLTRGENLVTTQQGAAMLGMSRPAFIQLLDRGEMPHHRVGNQRRVLLNDLLGYLHRRDGDRWVKQAEMEAWLDLMEKSGGLPVATSWTREDEQDKRD